MKLIKYFSEGAYNLILDFKELDYISSAGLRVVFVAQKKVNSLGTKLEITGSNENIKEVFNITGFASIINIK
jgi:anti-anti-sigma factor